MANNHHYSTVVAQAMADNPAWRHGQAAFNALPGWLQEEVRGTWRDPFHMTDSLDVNTFIEWAHGQINEKAAW